MTRMPEIDLLSLEADLVRDEGEILYAYPDSEGYLTLGVGILIDKRRGGGITREESRYLLRNRIASKMADLDRHLPWWRRLSPARQRVVANLCFNLGIDGLLKFRNTLAAMERGDYVGAAHGLLDSKWAGQVGNRADRLAQMMEHG